MEGCKSSIEIIIVSLKEPITGPLTEPITGHCFLKQWMTAISK